MNWRGKPLVSYLVIIQLIASTTTDTGLTVTCQLDANAYERVSRSPTTRWHPSTSNPLHSTASGTTPSPQGCQTDEAVIRAQALMKGASAARSRSSVPNCRH